MKKSLKKLNPGVYLMHDERDEIIYVGKAISLKNRVRQYFQSSRNKGAKIEQMVTHIARFEYIITDSELEALVLESNLIKEHRPKYNTMLKDDKSYPFIKVTVQEFYPRVLFARRMKKDKAIDILAPIPVAGAVKDVIELVPKACIRCAPATAIIPRENCGMLAGRACIIIWSSAWHPVPGNAEPAGVLQRKLIQKVLKLLQWGFSGNNPRRLTAHEDADGIGRDAV